MKKLLIVVASIIVFSTYIFNVSEVKGASSPYDVESSVRNNWNSIYGLKNFPQTSGKRFAYDVYSKKFTSTGYKIVSKNFGNGTMDYVNFQGWAVLHGYKRHTTSNHETYIVARKVVGTSGVGTTKVYGTLPYGNLSATEDLEYNNQGPNNVYNECPSGATNKNNQDDCNMRYDNVGFNAYLPLDELFPDSKESASWTLFLVKRVDSHIVYTPLSMPFNFSDRAYSNGEISLSSGINASSLQMNETSVIRRTSPRQSALNYYNTYGKFNYFTTNRFYTRIDSDEDETAVWYGVRTPEESNAKRWATSAYWTFGGDQALLSYRTDYSPPADGSCPKPVKPAPRYSYEFDFEVTKIDGKTVEKNQNTNTTVDVKRKSFASERNAAKNDIQDDINTRRSKKTQLTNELNTLKQQESKLQSDLDQADESGDYNKQNQLLRDLQAKRQEIANKECYINTVQEEIDHYQNELDTLKAKETSNSNLSTSVILKFNNVQQASPISTTLTENETKTLNYTWKLTADGNVLADINPSRQSVSGMTEDTYSNNTRQTPIYVSSNFTPNACAKPNETSYAEGVVRTINSNTQGQQVFKEKIYTTLQMSSKDKKRRAGLGFDYTVINKYENEDSMSSGTGPIRTTTFMPNLVSHLPYSNSTWSSNTNGLKISGFKVALQNTNVSGTNRDQEKQWKLPNYYVEEYSGNVFDSSYASHPKRNPNDKIINGGRKWYLGFNQPDGAYNFTSLSENAGINNLNTCIVGTVNVEGTLIGEPDGKDDFIKRSVNPTTAFPYGTGWNWKNKEGLLTGLDNWYLDWESEPTQIPLSQYEKTFFLTPELIREIKKYNKDENYEYELGKSLFDSINVPKVGG